MKTWRGWGFLAALFLAVCSASSADTYLLTDLSPGTAAAINESGIIALKVGNSGVIYDHGQLIDLGHLPGGVSNTPFAINPSGQVVGYELLSNASTHAYLYSAGSIQDLGTPFGGTDIRAFDISDSGKIVGYGSFSDGTSHGFTFSAGTFSDLGTLGGANSAALGVNSIGDVVGWSSVTTDTDPHAFVYRNGVMQDLFVLNNIGYSSGTRINSSGTIIGTTRDHVAFVYGNGDFSVLTLPELPSEANGINDDGTVVGSFTRAGSNPHAFVYTPGAAVVDLNTLVTLSDGSTPGFTELLSASGINSSGQIVGEGNYFDGNVQTTHAFLLTLIGSVTASPQFAQPAGYYSEPVVIGLTSTTPGAKIRYTLDNSTPSPSNGTLFYADFELTTSATVRAIAYTGGLNPSEVVEAHYDIATPPTSPVFSLSGGTYFGTQSISITDSTPGVTIYYTLDGSQPSTSNGLVYTQPVQLNSTTTLIAVATLQGFSDSPTNSALYTIRPYPPAGQPSFSPSSGTYPGSVNVSIFASPGGVSIRYTTDGSTPTATYGTVYSSPLSIKTTTTLKAVAYSDTLPESTIGQATFTIITPPTPTPTPSRAPTPTPTPSPHPSGTPTPSPRPSATPTPTPSPTATPTPTPTPTRIPSPTPTPTPTPRPLSAPVFSPTPGTYSESQYVTISSPDGANILLTVDGTTPTLANGAGYSGPLPIVAGVTTIKAIAFQNGRADTSPVASATYTILPPPAAAAPQFAPSVATIYASSQTVSLTSASNNTYIHYSTDGTEPNGSTGIFYNGPFTVTAGTTVKAVAFGAGYSTSSVSVITYVQAPLPIPSSSLPAGSYHGTQLVSLSSVITGSAIRYTVDGTTPTPTHGTLYSDPVRITRNTTLKAAAYKAGAITSNVTTSVFTILSPVTLNIEAESLSFEVQGAIANVLLQASASGGKYVDFTADSTGDTITFTLPNVAPGTYDVRLLWRGDRDNGIVSVSIDGRVLGSLLDEYGATPSYHTTSGGVWYSNGGDHVVQFQVAGKRSSASGYHFSADKFILVGQ